MQPFLVRPLDALRAAVAGSRAVALQQAAHALFEAGGRRALPGFAQAALRRAIEKEASGVLASVGVAERALEATGARAVVQQTARSAARQVARGLTAAAGAGALVDGGLALVHVVPRVRSGSMTPRAAFATVAREAGSGAAATAAGTATAALLVAVTGGLAAPALFVVAAAASLGAKAGIDRWLAVRQGDGSCARFGVSHRPISATVLRRAQSSN